MQEDKNIILYNASAGSGKTHQLVSNYLTIALRYPDSKSFEKILALTFTNKAANEMKERILAWLQLLSKQENKDKDIFTQMLNQTGLTIDELSMRAQSLLTDILHNYSRFVVSTIDSFNYKLIKSFAKDLQLSSQLSLEIDNALDLEEAVFRLFSDASLHGGILKDFLLQEMKLSMTQGKSWRLDQNLIKGLGKLLEDVNYFHMQSFIEYDLVYFLSLRKDWESQRKSLESEAKTIGESYFQLLDKNALEPSQIKGGTGRGVGNFFQKLKNEDYSLPTKPTCKSVEDKDFTTKNNSEQDLIAQISPDIEKLFNQAKGKLLKINELKRMSQKLNVIALANEINKRLEQIKQEKQILFLSDLNKVIHKHIEEQPSAYIYEKIGQRFNTIFIDEFQDTSTIQWQNMAPLVGEKESLGQHTFLLGDPKQAIYRFRGGEQEILINLAKNKQVENKSLDTNYRSQEAIVNFNNSFYNFILDTLPDGDYKKVYQEGVTQKITTPGGGYVQVDLVENEKSAAKNKKENENSFLEEDEEEEKINKNSPVLTRLVKTVQELTHLQPQYNYSDICILVGKAKEAQMVSEILMANGIQVSTSESLLLSKSPSVILAIKFLRMLQSQCAEVMVVEFFIELYQQGKIKTREDLTTFLLSRKQQKIDEQLAWLKGQGFNMEIDKLLSNSLSGIIQEIIKGLEIEKDMYVQSFLDQSQKFQTKKINDLTKFLQYWDTQAGVLSVKTPSSTSAVKVMTRHKSKGLQFPVVILPFFDGQKNNDKTYWINYPHLDFDHFLIPYSQEYTPVNQEVYDQIETYKLKETLDNFNVLYVATTRAEQRMYFILPEKTQTGLGKFIIQYLQHIGIEQAGNYIIEGKQGGFSSVAASDKKYPIDIHKLRIGKAKKQWPLFLQYSTDKLPKFSSQEKYTERGNLWHEVLSRLSTAQDIDTIVETEKRKGVLPREDISILQEVLEKIITHPILKTYYSPGLKSYNEKPLIGNDGEIKKPDRLVQTPTGWVLIDYKTGEKENAHKQQLSRYAKELRDLGYYVEKAFLLYIEKDVQVDEVELLS